MAIWSPHRSPERYPMLWHTAIQSPPGEYLIAVVSSDREVIQLRYQFSAFKACLKVHPGHQSGKALAIRNTRVIALQDGDSFIVKVRISYSPKHLAEVLYEGL